ncbi:MAG: DsrE family protein [Sulfurimonas sp.]
MKFVTLFLMSMMTFVTLQAKEYKVVFDCSSADFDYINKRMWLVGETMDMIEAKGDTVSVALTLHGNCVPIVSKAFHEIVDDEEIIDTREAQERLTALSQRKNIKIIACNMSLNAHDISKKDLLPFVSVSDNSFIDTIRYQNEGYALMTFK